MGNTIELLGPFKSCRSCIGRVRFFFQTNQTNQRKQQTKNNDHNFCIANPGFGSASCCLRAFWIYFLDLLDPCGRISWKGNYWKVRIWDLLEKVPKISQMMVFHGDEYHGSIRTKIRQKMLRKIQLFQLSMMFVVWFQKKCPVLEGIPPKWGWTTKSSWSNHLLSMSFCGPSTYTILAHYSPEN